MACSTASSEMSSSPSAVADVSSAASAAIVLESVVPDIFLCLSSRRTACRDQPAGFPAPRPYHRQEPSPIGVPYGDEPIFHVRMQLIRILRAILIGEDRHRFLEGYSVTSQVRCRFRRVPLKS